MMDDSARQIRQRIIWIILRAFFGVVFVTFLVVFAITGLAISNSLDIPPFERLPITARLEGYYAGHGSWEGVVALLQGENAITLLDANKRVIIDHGVSVGEGGAVYEPAPRNILINLKLDEEVAGYLVFDRETVPTQLGVVTAILFPVSVVAAFLILLAAVLIAILSRRIVTPLAEVIAVSRAVAAGKLDARVQVQGTQDLLVLTDSFNQMASSLERNDRERRELLADIAHELRTPISAIRGRLEGMLDGIYPADEQHISRALKANYMLERLVEDLRLLTLTESRQLSFEKKTIDLRAMAEHMLEVFSAEAEEKRIVLALDPCSGAYFIQADPQRLEQVVGNLVGNALRYVPEGGRVRLVLEQSAGLASLAVIDNGSGIPEEDLPYIFNRFWRKDKSRARRSGGSGLGLAIAKQLAEAQGGSLSAENVPEGGLKMTLTFPAL